MTVFYTVSYSIGYCLDFVSTTLYGEGLFYLKVNLAYPASLKALHSNNSETNAR